MKPAVYDQTRLDSATSAFYCHAIDTLDQNGVPFLVGGAYSLARYTGIIRHTKDFDVFLRRADYQRALTGLAREGYRTEVTFPHWLAKVYHNDNFIDIIFSSGNAEVQIDDAWFKYAVEEVVLDRAVLLCPPEETIWSKAFIMERERFDGADINHLLRSCGPSLDWPRLLRRFGPHWRLLLSHLILFGYVYPAERAGIPDALIHELLDRLRQEQASPPPANRVCMGALLSRSQYLIDVKEWGYQDPRLPPRGRMSPEDIAHWTANIGIDNPSLEQ
jgi:hypothetical protein